jgi:hypothetical protein
VGDSREDSGQENANRNAHRKDKAHKVSDGNKGSVGNWLRDNFLDKYLKTNSLCPETLWEAQFKNVRLVYVAEETSRQHGIQAGAWVPLAAFYQSLLGKSGTKRSKTEKFGKLALWPDESAFKGAAKEGVFSNKIGAIRKKPCTLQWDNRKDD